MKADINECRNEKVKFTMSCYCFGGMSEFKGIPGLINAVSTCTRKS